MIAKELRNYRLTVVENGGAVRLTGLVVDNSTGAVVDLIMMKRKYSGVVRLGATYVTPAGVDFIPTKFVMAGIVGTVSGGNFSFVAVVRRADFATYTLKAPVDGRLRGQRDKR